MSDSYGAIRDHEYLYTVRVRRGNAKYKAGEVVQVRARGMKGVATLLQVEDDNVVYVTKEVVK